MIKIDPNTFYSRKDLETLLAPYRLHVNTFIARVRPAKRFGSLFWGRDLIDAIDAAPLLREGRVETAAKVGQCLSSARTGDRGQGAKPRKSSGKIGGIFDPADLGLSDSA